MEKLEEMGTDRNIEISRRHGVNNDLFGVSFANLKKMKKVIEMNHDLAIQLWDTNNYDARNLATYLADPKQITADLANKWVEDIDYYIASDMVSGLFAKSPSWKKIMYNWIESDKEYVKSTAYYILASALKQNNEITKEEINDHLEIIKSTIHYESNRVKHCMNNALIAIGIFRPEFTDTALSIARSIGKVEVDHGKTNCKTPDAIDYIKRAETRNKNRKKKKN